MAVLDLMLWERIDAIIYTVLTVVGIMGFVVLVLIILTSLFSKGGHK